MPPPVPTTPMMVSDPTIDRLHAALQHIERQPNILTVDEFRPFEPLFQKDSPVFQQADGSIDTNRVTALSERFLKTIRDLYQITVIIRSRTNPEVVVKLPPLLTPFRMIPNNETTDRIVSTNQQMFHHHVPKYGAEAFRNMVAVLMLEQRNNTGVIESYRQAFRRCDADFQQRYGIAPVADTQAAPEVMTELLMDDDD